jgi:AAA domain/Relaxase/Mobilisation nuclease domain
LGKGHPASVSDVGRSYAGERRTEFLGLKLTPSEWNELDTAAAQDGGTLSEFCRELLFQRLPAAAARGRRNAESAAAMREVLSPIGNNLNQLAYQMNRSDGRELDRALLASVEEQSSGRLTSCWTSAAFNEMNPRIQTGRGITGAMRYVMGEGRDAKTMAIKILGPGETSRVVWMSGQGFGSTIRSEADADRARRIMEHDALNQKSSTRKCIEDCLHFSLAWAPGQKPTQPEMEEAARDALKFIGMENAKAVFVAHGDEDYAHLHIVASKINPATGMAYDLWASQRNLSLWAEKYEAEHGGIISMRRQDMNELRRAIAARDADAVLESLTKQRATFTPAQLTRALKKEIGDVHERERFRKEILASPKLVELQDPNKPLEAAAEAGEPWMMQRGGLDALSAAQKASAERAYELWATEKNPAAAKRHGLADYVNYVQARWAEDHPKVEHGGAAPTADRYTTRAVLESEMQVLLAAQDLAETTRHGIGDRNLRAVLSGDKFKSISEEQKRAFVHVTGAEGLALIDGQAGTGKSYTIAAVREAHERAGYKVIGLAPTLPAEDMAREGFTQASTAHKELFALNNGRRKWDAKTAVIVDEAAMIDTQSWAC